MAKLQVVLSTFLASNGWKNNRSINLLLFSFVPFYFSLSVGFFFFYLILLGGW